MSIRNILLLLTAAAALWGCQMYGSTGENMGYGNTGTTVTGSGYTGGSTAAVAISGYAFSPSSVSFPGSAGVTMTWTNHDSVTHTVTSDDGRFTSSGNIGPNGTYSLAFPTIPGTYAYHCSIHTYMKGSIVVK
jgi:plastocyanin